MHSGADLDAHRGAAIACKPAVRILQYAWWVTWKARWLWGWIAPAAIAVALGLTLPASKVLSTVLAACFEFSGLVVAFVGLTGDARGFGKSLGAPFGEWWNQRPGKLRLVTATATANVEALAVGMSVTRMKSPATDVDGRLAWLEQRMYAVQEQADAQAASLRALQEETRRDLRSEKKQREAADAELKDKLAEHAAGGIHLNAVALWWVFVGMALALWVSLAT